MILIPLVWTALFQRRWQSACVAGAAGGRIRNHLGGPHASTRCPHAGTRAGLWPGLLALSRRTDPAALTGSPFSDWRIPGVLLAGLVGGGFLLAGWWQWHGRRHARELSMLAGAGLVCFEAAELAWIGFQPLEAVFAIVGATTVWLACRTATPSCSP